MRLCRRNGGVSGLERSIHLFSVSWCSFLASVHPYILLRLSPGNRILLVNWKEG